MYNVFGHADTWKSPVLMSLLSDVRCLVFGMFLLLILLTFFVLCFRDFRSPVNFGRGRSSTRRRPFGIKISKECQQNIYIATMNCQFS